jgi:hypothetical protein
VFSSRKWQQFALFLNLLGTALLFYSFQATSSDFKLVTAKPEASVLDKDPYAIQATGVGNGTTNYALCVNNYTLIMSDAKSGVSVGHHGCPDWEHARPAAVVSIEHPRFEGLGFLLLMAGFFIQYLSVPQPRTIAELRKELKVLKAQEKAQREGN